MSKYRKGTGFINNTTYLVKMFSEYAERNKLYGKKLLRAGINQGKFKAA